MADGRHFENSFISISEPRIIRFRWKFGTQIQIFILSMPIWQNIEIFQTQDGGRTPYWKSFLAISRRHIGRSTRNLKQKWRITCRYRFRDQNCNFRKIKMADGRHFENSFISIYQPWIIRFRSNLVHRYKFSFRACKFDKKIEIFLIQDGGRTPYWKSFFLAISRRHIGWSTRNFEQKWRITCRYRTRDQICNFRKFKMADRRHFENSIISISQRELSDFDQIW